MNCFNVFFSFAAKNNIGVIIALWAPIILVWQFSPLSITIFCCYLLVYIPNHLISVLCAFLGLFYGYTNLVCNLLHISWWDLWCLSSSWRGQSNLLICGCLFFKFASFWMELQISDVMIWVGYLCLSIHQKVKVNYFEMFAI